MSDATVGGPSTAQPDGDWRRGFILQLLIAGISVTAIQAGRPMVTYRSLELGATPLEIGLVVSAFSILPVLTAVAIGRWIDRIGEAWFLVAAMAMIASGSLVTAFAGTLLLLAVGNAITGFGQITSLVAGQTMIANRGPRDRREDRYGWYSTVASLGQLLGPAIAAILVGGAIASAAEIGGILPEGADNPVAPVFLFGALAGAVCVVLALMLPRRRPPRPAHVEGDAPSMGLRAATSQVLRRPGMVSAMLVSVTVISSVDVLIAYLPVYGQAAGLSVETVAILLSVRAGASLISRIFMTRLIDVLGRTRLLTISMVMAGVSVAALPFITSVPVLFLLMVLIGLGLGLGQPMTIAWVANRSPRNERALALGVRLTGNRAALLIVPTIMGAIAGASGITAIWLVLAAFLGFGANVARRAPLDDPPSRPSDPTSPVQPVAQPEPSRPGSRTGMPGEVELPA
ncbi:MAG TPA: MFS transporter [Candidatus Saccharimonadales bacterium]|nr:MFS transporter [Candidatus Saccharimonadales bacterium]